MRGAILLPMAIGAACVFPGCRLRKEVPVQQIPSVSPPAKAAPSTSTAASASAGPPAPIESASTPSEIDVPHGAAVIAIGGIESTPAVTEPLIVAARNASTELVRGATALDAAVAGVAVLEDDPRLNAGVGSPLRFDGVTIECDAAVMSDRDGFAAVGALQRTGNPVRAARALLETPHRLLVGEGARQFARSVGLDERDLLVPEAAHAHARRLAALLSGPSPKAAPSTPTPPSPSGSGAAEPIPPRPSGSPGVPREPDGEAAAGDRPDLAFWQARARQLTEERGAEPASPPLPTPLQKSDRSAPVHGADTVVVLVRSAEGRFAGAISSGGPELALPGRAGDVVVPGAALWVGKDAAVAVSARGERVLETQLAWRVHERLGVVRSARLAAQWGLNELGEAGAVVVLNRAGSFVAASSPVAWAENGPTGESSSAPPTADSPTPALTAPGRAPTPARPSSEPAASASSAPAGAPLPAAGGDSLAPTAPSASARAARGAP